MKLSVVVGGQYGSEGKGAVAGYLAAWSEQPVVAVRVAGPNAGHTVYGRCPGSLCLSGGHLESAPGDGHPWKLRQVPVAAVTREDAQLIIAAGSEVDRDVLLREVAELDSAGYGVSDRLAVDSEATVIQPGHQDMEHDQLTDRIGSTGKGVGAARADRAMRSATLYGVAPWSVKSTWKMLRGPGTHVIIEGTQGYGLGQHAGLYPFCTSSDCRAIDFLAMAGISPWSFDTLQVWVVLRTRPIRVAGNSGPLHGETTWQSLGLPVERTTVTNRVRRVGAWDPNLARAAVDANGGYPVVSVALTMVDHEIPAIAGHSGPYADWAMRNGLAIPPDDDPVVAAEKYLGRIQADCGAPIRLVGTGPNTILER